MDTERDVRMHYQCIIDQLTKENAMLINSLATATNMQTMPAPMLACDDCPKIRGLMNGMQEV